MDSEKLIEYVKEYTFLYDQEDKRYSDSEKEKNLPGEKLEKL